MKWISAGDELPNYGDDVLCLLSNGAIVQSWYLDDWWIYWADGLDVIDPNDPRIIMYWLPIPAYPKDFKPTRPLMPF